MEGSTYQILVQLGERNTFETRFYIPLFWNILPKMTILKSNYFFSDAEKLIRVQKWWFPKHRIKDQLGVVAKFYL